MRQQRQTARSQEQAPVDEFGAGEIMPVPQVSDDGETPQHQATAMAPQPAAIYIDADQIRAEQYARTLAEARALRTSETIPGGRFLVNGEWVNAYGDLIDEKTGKIIQRRYQPADASRLF
jgi:hypothetical protein